MKLTDEKLLSLGITTEQIKKLRESERETELANLRQAEALIDAGWRYELPEIVNRKEGEPAHMATETWQWYWRSPPKRKGTKGRRYLSTNQAFNALNRQAA